MRDVRPFRAVARHGIRSGRLPTCIAYGVVPACTSAMYGVFKFILYLGVAAGLAGFAWPMFADHPELAKLPVETPRYLSFGGLGLIILGLAGRAATRPSESETVEWK